MAEVSRNFGAIGRGETTAPVEACPERGQPDQPGRAGEKGAYPREVEARNPASRDSIGRERGKRGPRGKHGREAEAAPTRMVVPRPRLRVAMTADPKPLGVRRSAPVRQEMSQDGHPHGEAVQRVRRMRTQC